MPPPGAKLPTPAALHAHCLLHYFLQLFWPVNRICRPSCRSCCLFSPLVIGLAANPIPPGVPLHWNVGPSGTARRFCNRQSGAAPSRRARGCRRATLNDHRTGQAPEPNSPGHQDGRCPLLFTRTACCFILYSFFICCLRICRSNGSGAKAEVMPPDEPHK